MKTLSIVVSFRRLTADKELRDERDVALEIISAAQERAVREIKMAASAARKGIVCIRCESNSHTYVSIYGSRNGWPSGAYCLEPCWKAIQAEDPPEIKG